MAAWPSSRAEAAASGGKSRWLTPGEGARLALSARTASELEETAQLVSQKYGSEVSIMADAAAREQVDRAVAQTWEETRDPPLSVGDMTTYELGVQVPPGQGASIERAAELAVFLGSDDCGALPGRLIRSFANRFEELPRRVDEIMAPEAYLLRRVDPERPFATSPSYPTLPMSGP